MFPPNLEHPNSTGRLDLFALYGPTVHYYSVDSSFSKESIGLAKAQLQKSQQRKKMEANKKKGISENTVTKTSFNKSATQGTKGKVIATTRKLMEAPQRLLQEEDIDELMPELTCQKDKDTINGFVNLTCGRGA